MKKKSHHGYINLFFLPAQGSEPLRNLFGVKENNLIASKKTYFEGTFVINTKYVHFLNLQKKFHKIKSRAVCFQRTLVNMSDLDLSIHTYAHVHIFILLLMNFDLRVLANS